MRARPQRLARAHSSTHREAREHAIHCVWLGSDHVELSLQYQKRGSVTPPQLPGDEQRKTCKREIATPSSACSRLSVFIMSAYDTML